MSAIQPAFTDQYKVESLIKALTGVIGPEWVALSDLKTRMLHAKISIQTEPLAEWLAHLVSAGKVERKTDGARRLYRLTREYDIDRIAPRQERSIEASQPKPPATPPRVPVIPMRTEWPDWTIHEIDRLNGLINAQTDANEHLRQRLEEMEHAIMEHKTETKRALSIYGSENALEEMVMQVALSPQFADLTPVEHRYVASVGLASGLNPVFHLHAWKQNERGKEVLKVVPDYKALIASARDPIMTSDRRLSEGEMSARGIPQQDIDEGAIGYEVTGTNLKHAIMARTAKVEYTPFKGFGWWAAMKDKDEWSGPTGKRKKTTARVANDTPTGRDGEWVAKKRAIRDLFNQISDLSLKFVDIPGATVEGDEWVFEGDPDAIEGEYTERDDPPWTLEAMQRAGAYSFGRDVTDDEIHAALGCDDWRKVPITPDEWKVIVDQIAAKKEIADRIATIKEITTAGQAAPEIGQESDAVAPVIDEHGEVIEPPEVRIRKDRDGDLCDECDQPATNDGPFPKLCAPCASRAADSEAASAG